MAQGFAVDTNLIAADGGFRVSELTALTWHDVLPREDGRVQLSIKGKGGVLRQVPLPQEIRASLLSLRGEAGSDDPVFISRKGGRLIERGISRHG